MYFWNDRDELLKERDALRAQLAACKAQRDGLADMLLDNARPVSVYGNTFTDIRMSRDDAWALYQLIASFTDYVQSRVDKDIDAERAGKQEEE